MLNATDVGVDQRDWETKFATDNLLSSVRGAFDHHTGVPELKEHKRTWERRGKRIDTIKDLILCYYSSFEVLRIPVKGRYMLIQQQITKLHHAIQDGCDDSFWVRRMARMLPNSDELSVYLQAAFDHFTTDLDIPFNFVEVSLRSNSIPVDFGSHILQLATYVQRVTKKQPAWVFKRLSVIVASSIFLDCIRYRKGDVVPFIERLADQVSRLS